jgi:cytochrome c553
MQRALAAAIGLAAIAAAVTASAEPPAGAAACSGCHPASARVSSPVPRLAGLDRAAIAKAMRTDTLRSVSTCAPADDGTTRIAANPAIVANRNTMNLSLCWTL